MPTEFMNRRMDLHHSFLGGTNYLVMDTSYPIKLAGKVMKIFIATTTYIDGNWVIVNTSNEEILTINKNNVYDFGDNVIRDNYGGDEKLYPTSADVYKFNDYVIALIDFDNNTLKLLSQSNFNHIYTNLESSTANLKMFDISGGDNIEGIDQALSAEAFKDAADYESAENSFALMRRNTDLVVYQAPETGNENKYVPVANVENKNINKFNVSALPLIYPSINTGYVNSFDCIDSVKSLIQLNGKVNDKFVKEYCYTATEMADLISRVCNSTSNSIMKEYFKYFWDNIPSEDKDNYLYFIRDNKDMNNGGPYSNAYFGRSSSQVVIPLLKDDLRLCSIEAAGPNTKNLNNENPTLPPELNYLFSPTAGYMFGNWWSSSFDVEDDDNMVWCDFVVFRSAPLRSKDIYAYKAKFINCDTLSTRGFVLYEYNSFAYYKDYLNSNNTPTFYEMFDSVTGTERCSNYGDTTHIARIVSTDVDDVYTDDTNLTFVKNFINFFGNKDANYKAYVKDQIAKAVNIPNHGAYCFDFPGQNEASQYDKGHFLPTPVVSIYLDELGTYINSNNLYDLSANSQTFNPNNYIYCVNNQARNVGEETFLLYLMMFYNYTDINDDTANLNILRDHKNNIRHPGLNDNRNFRFKVSKDMLPRASGNTLGISVIDKGSDKSLPERYQKFLNIEFVKMMARAINRHHTDSNHLYADISSCRKFAKSRIRFAKENTITGVLEDTCLKYVEDNGTWNLMLNSGTNSYTMLYLVKLSGGTAQLVRATYENVCDAISYNGSVLLYHAEGTKDLGVPGDNATEVYRIHYFTNYDGIASYKQHSSNPNDAIGYYDFYTNDNKVCNKNSYNSNNEYDKAYICYNSNYTESDLPADLTTRIVFVETNYMVGNYGTTRADCGIMRNLQDGVPTIVVKSNPSYGTVTTIDLALLDFSVLNYRISRGKSILDILPEGTTIYANGPAPKLSKIKNKAGEFIFNSDSYIDFVSNVFVTEETRGIDSNVSYTDNGEKFVPPILSENQLKYAGGTGIREEYYKGKSFLQFLNYITMYNMSRPMDGQNVDAVQSTYYPVYKKNELDKVDHISATSMWIIKGQYNLYPVVPSARELTTNAVIYRNNKNMTYYESDSSSTTETYPAPGTFAPAATFTVTSIGSSRVKLSGQETITEGGTPTTVNIWVNKTEIAEDTEGLFMDSHNNIVGLEAPVTIVSKINYIGNRYGFNDAYIYKTNASLETEDVTTAYVSLEKMYASKEEAGNKTVMNISLNDENGILLNTNGTLGDIECDKLNWYNLLMALSNNKSIDILSENVRKIKNDINHVVEEKSQIISDKVTVAQNANPSSGATLNTKYNLFDYDTTPSGGIKNRGVLVIVNDDDGGVHLKRMYISSEGLLCTKEYYDAHNT